MTRSRWLVAALASLGGLTGCSDTLAPEGQIVLTVVTDAPLPPADGFPDDSRALFDRLRFDIVPPGEVGPCDGCSRDFAVDRDMVAAGDASIGIVPPVGESGWRVRVRLFRSGGTASAEPRAASTLETTVALEPIAQEGKLPFSVVLWTDDVAQPVGSLDAPVEPVAGRVDGLVGTWPGAQRTTCSEPAGPGEVCIVGGAFWMGDPRLDFSAAFDLDGGLERLVVLSPFYMHVAEVGVPAFRASGLAQSLAPGVPSDNPHEPDQNFPRCTFTSDPGAFEQHPTVCLSWTKAAEYCASIGGSLPTEAQLEYAMSGLGRSAYVWGEELPSCSDATFGRASPSDACAALGVGVAPVGAGVRDRLPIDGFDVVDLAGNAMEWARDRWNRQQEPCWGTGLRVDPWCDAPSPIDGDDLRVVRGGDWAANATELRAAIRHRIFNEEFAVSARIGFRCARPGTN
jgi:formylglycine-generating enzyme required for sulfatase activity